MSKGEIGNRCPRHVLEHGNQGVFVDPNGPHESAGKLAAEPTLEMTDEYSHRFNALGTLHVCKHCGAAYWVSG